MKYLLIIFYFWLSVSQSSAQSINSLGFKSGVSTTNQTWYYSSTGVNEKTTYRNGFYCVASLEYDKPKYLSYLIDVGYSQKGFKQDIEITNPYYPEGTGLFQTVDTRIDYATVAPSIKTRINAGHWMIFMLAGPRIDYQLGFQSEFDFITYSAGDQFNQLLLGLSGGAGFGFTKEKYKVTAEFQYNYDLSKVLNLSSLTVKNKGFIANAGIQWYLHHKK